MCAQYIIKASLKSLAKKHGWAIPPEWEDVDVRVLPYRPGAVVVAEADGAQVKTMNYSLVPAWSKTPRVKFATHNARLETIAEKPTWKRPFQKQRCLVPVSHFIEPIYHGDYAGHMVQFHPKDEHVLMAAGVWDHWVNKETGETLETFAIITDEPDKFVAHTGHDRMPVFLEQANWDRWLKPESAPANELKELLSKGHREKLDLGVTKDRPMKPGWEKRR